MDTDGDGMDNRREYLAGTDPMDRGSALRILSVVAGDESACVEWTGGTGVTQYLQWTDGLDKPWRSVFTNVAPTPVTNLLRDWPRKTGFYRIRVAVP